MKRLQFRSITQMRGAVAVEMALLLIPMLVLVFGVAEFGRAIYQYDILTKSVRTAARYLSQFSPGDPNNAADVAKYNGFKGEATRLAVYDESTGGVLAPGLTDSMVKISPPADTTVSEDGVTITLTLVKVCIEGYSFQFLLDPRTFLGGGESSIEFGAICASMRQS